MYNGNNLYHKFKKEIEDMGFIVEPMAKFPFAHVFFKTPVYKHRILSIPMKLTPFSYKESWGKFSLDRASKYNESLETGKTKEIQNRKDIVPGYYYLKDKLKRRLYMLRNSVDFNKTILQNSKNRTLA